MKHLELHIIQSVPVACLNRDDLNSPKTAVFGGVQRARVSSQSWKRSIREMAKELLPSYFHGNRTRRLVYALKTRLVNKDIQEECAIVIAEHVANIIETIDSKADETGIKKIKTLMFFSDAEYDSIADSITRSEEVKNALSELAAALNVGDDKKKDAGIKKAMQKMEKTIEKGTIARSIKAAQLKDAADIALFGRMVANDPSLNVEAAAMFSHALSTHKVDNEIDFFAAVDDLQSQSEAGAGMTSTLEFNSATYYRFTALNLDMLADNEHLKSLSSDERRNIVRAFVEATIKAIPSARKNTMNGNTLPTYVLGVVREKGHPIQLINAFETPVSSDRGYSVKSAELLKTEYAKLADTWDIKAAYAKAIPDIDLTVFLDEVVQHVI